MAKTYKAVKISKGSSGWGGPLVIEPTAQRNKVVSVTGGGIHPVAQRIADMTGAEAVENAIKIARAYTGRNAVIAFSGGFHGRTFMTMTLTGKVAPYKAGFGAMMPDVFHVPFPNALHGVSTEDSFAAMESLFKTDLDPTRLAAVIFGRWDPIKATLAALLFGFASNLQNALSVVGSPVPSEFMLMLPYVVTIIAVAGLVGKSRPPAASGTPYIKG